MEVFLPIKDFEELYDISNYGRVYSHITNKILKNVINKDGYYILCLHKNGEKYNKKPHRLVAEAFLPNPNNLPCVNHKDENKQNNFVWINDDGSIDYEKSNLEWCTQKYNVNYGTHNERMAASKRGIPKPFLIERNKRLCSKPVVAVDKDGNAVMEFPSTMEAQRNGFNSGAVSACCRNCYYGSNYYKCYQWYFKSEWLQMQKKCGSSQKRNRNSIED